MREHSCPACSHTEDRDLNAAKNILDRGRNSLHVGSGRYESPPVQTVLPGFARYSGRGDAKHAVEVGSSAA
uniref:zinc ribbon domain-containing protein n=1 Tax=Halegenticoccus tardaugens TaxID=2071624 RepID=UPI001E28D8B3|nr:zinc ribbon domain-containing protein [Halegenticoccus tardaugens]